ncbi:MAG: S66 peptidase family protein [Bacteroidota bacterium]
MIRPAKLNRGDKVATISLSWGGAGDLPHRYAIGKKQLQDTFGVEVVETKYALKSSDWIAKNPQARVDDLMEALLDPSIKAIISNIGGEDSIRTLPYVNLETIRNNPKIFLGFSDTTVTHFAFYKAGVTSLYGTSLLVGFAENNGMHDYQIADIERTLFSNETVGQIHPNQAGWTSERLDWFDPNNQTISRKLISNTSWRWLQGSGKVTGELLGGCVEVLEFLKDTDFWVQPEDWKGKMMFLETSEVQMSPTNFRWILRNYAASGILKNINGLMVGRPLDGKYWKEYDEQLLQVIRAEEGLVNLPIVTGMDFGHTCPVFTLPYGVRATLNCDQQIFFIDESAVI